MDNETKPKVFIYTQIFCGYCSAARKLLKNKGVEFDEVDITLKADQRREMMERSGRQTVPQIFIGDEHIGGFDDMMELDQDGRLDELLGLTG